MTPYFWLLALICSFFVPSWAALALGITSSLALGNPFLEKTKKLTPKLLSASIVGMGAGMQLDVVAKVGLHGIGKTFLGIAFALGLGWGIGKILKVPYKISTLISVGTAICGGSAIAAVSPVIGSKSEETSIALGTVFLLNALGLILFPYFGHVLALTEPQFGTWAALAIHDTSSVVGATLAYGQKALEIGTTLKLTRALWIIPVTLFVTFLNRKNSNSSSKPKRPWFILGFLGCAALVTWIPELRAPGHQLEWVAKKTLVLTLFLIGSNLNKTAIKNLGFRPFIQGVGLWVVVAAVSLTAILSNLI